ncbi:YtxH domain-containing protein [Cellulomonas endophytica]|uniref:YtxH domain-containing protein n=1 Tax=Cellulomonas endophytica TaxID=2494735 RepID=UPI00101159BD|nr:YtxH domain-containing protein [Cellulomonas endophytica]
MKGRIGFVLGAGVGYVLGTRAGRQQFDRIKHGATGVWNHPKVQGVVHDAESQVQSFAKDRGTALKDKAVGVAKQALQGEKGSDLPDGPVPPVTAVPPTSATTTPSTAVPTSTDDGPAYGAGSGTSGPAGPASNRP